MWTACDPKHQFYNPYSYGGNPVNTVDPNGENVIGAIIGALINGYVQGANSSGSLYPDDWSGKDLFAAGMGAVSGAMGGSAIENSIAVSSFEAGNMPTTAYGARSVFGGKGGIDKILERVPSTQAKMDQLFENKLTNISLKYERIVESYGDCAEELMCPEAGGVCRGFPNLAITGNECNASALSSSIDGLYEQTKDYFNNKLTFVETPPGKGPFIVLYRNKAWLAGKTFEDAFLYGEGHVGIYFNGYVHHYNGMIQWNTPLEMQALLPYFTPYYFPININR